VLLAHMVQECGVNQCECSVLDLLQDRQGSLDPVALCIYAGI
jgi:hypothetical protein